MGPSLGSLNIRILGEWNDVKSNGDRPSVVGGSISIGLTSLVELPLHLVELRCQLGDSIRIVPKCPEGILGGLVMKTALTPQRSFESAVCLDASCPHDGPFYGSR